MDPAAENLLDEQERADLQSQFRGRGERREDHEVEKTRRGREGGEEADLEDVLGEEGEPDEGADVVRELCRCCGGVESGGLGMGVVQRELIDVACQSDNFVQTDGHDCCCGRPQCCVRSIYCGEIRGLLGEIQSLPVAQPLLLQ